MLGVYPRPQRDASIGILRAFVGTDLLDADSSRRMVSSQLEE
jgi:hypothetical protein